MSSRVKGPSVTKMTGIMSFRVTGDSVTKIRGI